jgi:hypothetical protein
MKKSYVYSVVVNHSVYNTKNGIATGVALNDTSLSTVEDVKKLLSESEIKINTGHMEGQSTETNIKIDMSKTTINRKNGYWDVMLYVTFTDSTINKYEQRVLWIIFPRTKETASESNQCVFLPLEENITADDIINDNEKDEDEDKNNDDDNAEDDIDELLGVVREVLVDDALIVVPLFDRAVQKKVFAKKCLHTLLMLIQQQ